jgi:chalcone isomerase-like protein
MVRMTAKLPSLLVFAAFLAGPLQECAAELEKTEDGHYITGSGTRTKRVLFVDVQVYRATHTMKELPASPTAQGVVEADIDKRMTIRMLRNVDLHRIIDGIKEGYRRNGWKDMKKVKKLFSILTGHLSTGDTFWVEYDPERETTTAIGKGGRRSSIEGRDFMIATWAAWFYKIDSPGLSKRLIKNLTSLPTRTEKE